NTSVARYLSGSRAALRVAGVGERLAFAFADEVLALALAFEFVSARWHALPARPSRATSKTDTSPMVLCRVVVMTVSEILSAIARLLEGGCAEGSCRIARVGSESNRVHWSLHVVLTSHSHRGFSPV